MAILTTILNGITGLSFRTQVNDNFTALNNAKSETTHNHNTLYATKATETTVATNTTDIGLVDDRVTALESFHTYDYNIASNITVTNDVYENVLTLTTPIREAGTYEIRMSQMYSLNSTINSAFFRFRVNGGAYVEVRREPKDNTDIIPMDYWKVLTHAGGTTITVEIEARKGNASDILTIAEINAAVTRVG
jgi:hypothetical protein